MEYKHFRCIFKEISKEIIKKKKKKNIVSDSMED